MRCVLKRLFCFLIVLTASTGSVPITATVDLELTVFDGLFECSVTKRFYSDMQQ